MHEWMDGCARVRIDAGKVSGRKCTYIHTSIHLPTHAPPPKKNNTHRWLFAGESMRHSKLLIPLYAQPSSFILAGAGAGIGVETATHSVGGGTTTTTPPRSALLVRRHGASASATTTTTTTTRRRRRSSLGANEGEDEEEEAEEEDEDGSVINMPLSVPMQSSPLPSPARLLRRLSASGGGGGDPPSSQRGGESERGVTPSAEVGGATGCVCIVCTAACCVWCRGWFA